jgi:hypothetical protein
LLIFSIQKIIKNSQKYGFRIRYEIRDPDKTHPGSQIRIRNTTCYTAPEGPPEIIRFLLEVHEREIVEDEGNLVLLLLQWSVCFLIVLQNNIFYIGHKIFFISGKK